MSGRLRARTIFNIKPASSIRSWIAIGARLIFWPLALLTLAALVLQLGAYRKEFKIAGPFAAETNPARHSLIVVVPQEGRAAWWRQPLLGDDSGKASRSFLELWIDDRELGPPHTLHETIRQGTTTGFSHWGPNVIFSLPPGVKNAAETIATLRYSVRPRAWVAFALAVSSALLSWFLFIRSLAESYGEPVLRAPYLILFGLCCVGLIASAVYVASSLYALATGWALPTTALIRWSPIAAWAARNEPYFGYLLLMLAGLGSATTWLIGSSALRQPLVESNEQSLQRLFAWCGFPIAACAFILCISAIWAGILRPGDPNASNIAGLIPFLDGGSYLTTSYDQARDGVWNAHALRRPLAAAFRSALLVFGDFSLQYMLILQACLVAGAVCLATHTIVKWRGVWAGLAFFALTYIYARYFVPTTLTEPLGLFWALLSIPFFIEAFRSRSVKPALVAFAMTAVALMTRMGSMFTIPALLIWLVWQFGKGAAAKLRIGLLASGILLGVLSLNALLQQAYGTGEGLAGSNFSYELCGLSFGTTWEGCLRKLASEGTPVEGSEDARVRQLYSAAWKNFQADPGPFFRRLAEGAEAFITEFPNVIWKGCGRAIDEPNWLFPNLLAAISLIGFLYGAARRATAVELTFWMFLWTSIVASSSFVYFDDGPRALAASHPLIALFFAMGMTSLASAPAASPPHSRLLQNGVLGLIATTALFICGPWMAHHFSSIGTMVAATPLQKRNEAFVFGGRRMSGFLVVEDNLPLRDDIPSLHLADFDAIVRQSGVEVYQELIHPTLPPLPFGFVFAPRLEQGRSSDFQYIVPAQVVERRDVPAWHFDLKRWGAEQSVCGDCWFYVIKAEPWRPLNPK